MKAHRRGIPRLTWFKLAVCLCLAATVSYTHLTLPTNSRV